MLSLRARLMLGLLGLAAVGLVILDVVSYTALRSYLSDRSDQQVESALGPVGRALVLRDVGVPPPPAGAPPGGEGGTPIVGGAPPGVEPAAAPKSLRPFVRRLREAHGEEPGGAQLPPGTFGELRNRHGKVVDHVVFSYGESGLPRPRFPSQLPTSGSPGAPDAFTVAASDPSASDFRALAVTGPMDSNTLVVAVPLSDLNQTLHRLRLIEAIVTAAVLIALGVLAWWVIRVGLRPLGRMEQTANAIAAGDLSRRVESTDERTEVGRLGTALNSMLGQIERAFGQRQASEDRLRRFLADASHELRTPLSSIRGYAELFRLGPAQDPEELGKAMRRIEDEATRMGGLVDDLLTLARLDEVPEPVREPVDLAAVAADACDDARAAAPERSIGLSADGPANVLGDADQLRQVATNLLRNALVHTPDGTPVEVSVNAEHGRATLEVRDRGSGLPDGVGDLVFERFWRDGGSRGGEVKGTGLGLAIAAAIVRAHGGEAHARNAADGGALFTVALPTQVAEPSGARD
jgi:two-component system OmpR family sensor kinase